MGCRTRARRTCTPSADSPRRSRRPSRSTTASSSSWSRAPSTSLTTSTTACTVRDRAAHTEKRKGSCEHGRGALCLGECKGACGTVRCQKLALQLSVEVLCSVGLLRNKANTNRIKKKKKKKKKKS